MTRIVIPDVDRVSSVIREVAETAILPYFRKLSEGQVREKTGPTDLVTIADEAGERALTPRLVDLLPGSVVVGEEAASADSAVLDRLSGDAPVWVIDPVDGTLNFAAGRATFAVIVALVQGGRTVAGWIHDPCGQRTAVAVVGEGAWMDGRRMRVAAPAPLNTMRGAASTRFCAEGVGQRIMEGLMGMGGHVSLLSAAHEYLCLITGETHFSLYHRLMPWDHAAGVLLHAEAGGHSALANGTPYRPTLTDGSLLMAPDEASWRAVRKGLIG
ncbi:MAG TPA: inositol monophosphatase family protein [Azospirillum sp.]|nr:inositol monophosphatase family protein [Azospirillum sp.]